MEGTAPTCDDTTMTFRYADPDRRLAAVRLRQWSGIPGDRLDFARDGDEWHLRVPRPPVWRLEYRLELHHHDGGVDLVPDPVNPRRVGGAYGDNSVLQCPDYTEPAWLRWDGVVEHWREFTVAVPELTGELRAGIWSPDVRTRRVLVVHDGPEYERLGALTQYSAAMIEAGLVPAHHVVLLSPGDRDEWYSANPAYARALMVTVLSRVHAELGTSGPVVGVGASLGALAMLHAQRRHPGSFHGLFLQSGSFLRPGQDAHGSWSPRYQRIVRFVGRVLRSGGGRPVPTTLTCGVAEENLGNNRDIAAALSAQGYPVRFAEIPDTHNFTCWRDSLHPHLTALLHRVWG